MRRLQCQFTTSACQERCNFDQRPLCSCIGLSEPLDSGIFLPDGRGGRLLTCPMLCIPYNCRTQHAGFATRCCRTVACQIRSGPDLPGLVIFRHVSHDAGTTTQGPARRPSTTEAFQPVLRRIRVPPILPTIEPSLPLTQSHGQVGGTLVGEPGLPVVAVVVRRKC